MCQFHITCIQAQTNDKVASTYNNIWKTGDPSATDEILAEDFEQVCLIEFLLRPAAYTRVFGWGSFGRDQVHACLTVSNVQLSHLLWQPTIC